MCFASCKWSRVGALMFILRYCCNVISIPYVLILPLASTADNYITLYRLLSESFAERYAVWEDTTGINLWFNPIYIQHDANLHSLFISGNGSTCFGCYFHPSSGAHTTVSTASGICHTVTATCRYSGS
jgi:hypothetical protein